MVGARSGKNKESILSSKVISKIHLTEEEKGKINIALREALDAAKKIVNERSSVTHELVPTLYIEAFPEEEKLIKNKLYSNMAMVIGAERTECFRGVAEKEHAPRTMHRSYPFKSFGLRRHYITISSVIDERGANLTVMGGPFMGWL